MNTKIYAEMIKVTPEMAKDILETKNNGVGYGNRKIKNKQVAIISRCMAAGEWNAENGESIKFDKAGNLIDGQHRLSAVVEYGKPMMMFAIFNVSDEAFQTIDITSRRTASDTLSVYGETYCNTTAAAINFILRHTPGHPLYVSWANTLSNKEVLDYSMKNPGLHESVLYVYQYNKGGTSIVPFSIMAAIHYMASNAGNSELADSFCEQVYSGVGIVKNSGAHLLRERMLKDILSKSRLRKKERSALVIKAWNMYITGKKASMLRWYNDRGEKYPEIITE